jgi:F5/8 type C domain-containing protein
MTEDNQADSPVPLEWQATVSGNAELRLSAPRAGSASALRMDFDFKGGKGFVVARRTLRRAMPAEYAVRFRLRGRGATNNLELKLVDDTGRNVWRHVQTDLKPPARWRRFTIESRDIDFAWGPSSGHGISELGFVELAIVAGEGGAGTLWIADLAIEDRTPAHAPCAEASSAQPGFPAAAALEGSGWKPESGDRRPWISIDSTEPRTLGGLIIDWIEEAPARGFRVRASNTGSRWKTVYAAARAGGRRSYLYLPGLKSRYLKLELSEPSQGAVLRLQSFEFSRSIDAFWYAVAAAEPRGWHPRWLHREQSEWTPIGTSNGSECALMNGDGMVEVSSGSCSIEPMLWVEGRLFTWTDVLPRRELAEGWMPVPSVIWESEHWRLSIRAESAQSGELSVRYRFDSLADAPLSASLFVVVRPFQVTPPWQNFRNLGGVSRVHAVAWADRVLAINEAIWIEAAQPPAAAGAMGFDDGCIAARLQSGAVPDHAAAHDAFGFASAAIRFDLALLARGSCERALQCRAAGAARPAADRPFDWAARMPVAQWSGSGWIADAIRAALTATAHILVTRSGAALQPGPRRYTRSWIRDGAMMSAALLRMGYIEEVGEFIRWYAPHQRADGFVPCCVDREGIDWLVEHDSHGELIALIADHFRFAADRDALEASWIHVERAAAYIEGSLGADGLLPVSVSHEGYLAQPVHSFWDDFWALKGAGDAAELARVLGKAASAERWSALAARLRASTFASIDRTRAARSLDFIPGSVEWADFDPTATANAIYLLDVPEGIDRAALERTFDKYLDDWRARRSGALDSPNYTPYEIRIIGALVRLGRRDAALELLRFFLADRRPPPWNQWPEIAWRDRKAPAHVGDLPHTWISAEYVLAVRSLFAYEREADGTLILGAGLAPEWIEGKGVEVTSMRTLYGELSYSLRRADAHTLRCDIRGEIKARIILKPPLFATLRSVTVNGAPVAGIEADSVTIPGSPAQVTLIA